MNNSHKGNYTNMIDTAILIKELREDPRYKEIIIESEKYLECLK